MAAPWNGAATPHCPVPAISQIGGNTNGRIGGRELQEVHHHHPARKVVSSALCTTSGPTHRSTISSNYYRPAAPRPPPQLGSDFCGKRPKRGISKNNLGRGNSMKCNQSLTAQAVLNDVLNAPLEQPVDNFLEGKRLVLDDYVSLMKELGSRGECSKAVECFKWAVSREKKRNEQGKLVTIMISILGKLGRVDLAQQVFDRAKADGYGENVYAFSALVSAYGRSGLWKEAISVFELMKRSGCVPNIVTYNAVIDACGKGGVDFKQAMGYFDEMIKRHVKPDRITFNSLIAVCSRGGRWVEAQDLFEQMLHRGIEQDIFTYNTLLDALCKGGQMDLAASALCDMSERNIYPNAITYSTVIDGYAKAGRLNEALDLYHEMKNAGIPLDRVSYNTLLSVYAKFGRFEEALRICREMEDAGFKKDTVTYNALLGGYGKQGKYDQVKALFEEMRWQRVTPNVLTYSTLIDVYSKGGLQTEAMQVINEFKQTGLKPDVVLYSAYIDALCKSGSVGEAIHLLDKMTAEGITPNVVTCNSIIDSLGRSSKGNSRSYGQSAEFLADNDELVRSLENLSCVSSSPAGKNERSNNNANALQIVARNAFASLSIPEEIKQKSEDILGAVNIFHRMKKLGIKPNVVTFSVILNACSRCPSFKEASLLLEELRLFDSRVYGVAHGLLMGFRDRVWSKAQTLFDEVTRMDSATASAFYNALTDMLWHFGQRKGAQLVVLDGRSRQVWENAWCESCLDLHLMSAGAAQAMVHAWLLSIRSIVFEGRELPKLLSILTGWGKHSKVTGDSTLRRAVETLLLTLGAPFHLAKFNEGRFTSTGPVVDAWLRESGTLELLILHDKIVGKAEFAGVHVSAQRS